jgi:hypothetical protein
MGAYSICRDPKTKEWWYETPVRGRLVLEHPMLNKDAAYSKEEREELGLVGLIAPDITTLEKQAEKMRAAYLEQTSLQEKRFFLWSLYDRNETLFYRFVEGYLEEMLPLLEKGPSTPLSKPRGIYVEDMDGHRIEKILDNADMPGVRIFVTEKKGSPIGRAVLYTLIGGIHPGYVLPVWLEHDAAKEFEAAVKKKFPKSEIDWGKKEAKIAALKFKDEKELYWKPSYLPIHCTHSLQEFKRKAM